MIGFKSADLTKYTDAEARSLVFRQADLMARLFLIENSEREYEAGNLDGAGTLFHAELYLSDRMAYALWPPPFKGAIPIRFFRPKGCSQ